MEVKLVKGNYKMFYFLFPVFHFFTIEKNKNFIIFSDLLKSVLTEITKLLQKILM